MCVIAICDEERVTDHQVGQMFEDNPAGAGIAWREKQGIRGDVVVKWEKGLDLDAVTKLCREVPMPFVVHFRIPSVGGHTKALCHPFPVDKTAPLDLNGTTKGYVLFHNGHWGAWRNSTLEAAVRSNTPVPTGKWSDTRAMAFHASIYGPGILEMIDEKVVLFGPTRVEVFNGPQWDKVGKLWVSNKGWCNRSFRTTDSRRYGMHWHRSQDDEQKTLPAASDDADASEVVDVKADREAEVREGPAKRGKQRTAAQVPEGVDLDNLPFDQITQMFEEGAISKKQWKKARRKQEVKHRGPRSQRKRNRRGTSSTGAELVH